MDFSFFEIQQYYDTHLQGESKFDENECQNNSDLTFEFETHDNSVAPSDTTEMNEKQFKGLVYTRKGKARERQDNIQQQSHEQDLRPNQETRNFTSTDQDSSQAITKLTNSNIIDLPITQRKGVRSCTIYPLSNFLANKNLSPIFFALISQIDYIRFQMMYMKLQRCLNGRKRSLKK